MKLSTPAEEVATFFAKMLDHEYTTKDVFRKNFWKDWRKARGCKLIERLNWSTQVTAYKGCEVFEVFRVWRDSHPLSFILGNDIRGKGKNH